MSYLKRILFIIAVVAVAYNCKKKEAEPRETILEGKATVITDETLTPIIEDQISVFESEYKAKIDLISKSETEVVNALLDGSAKIAILSRKLSADELKVFNKKSLYPKITKFATDGIALIRNQKNNDTIVALSDVLDFMRGKPVDGIKGLAFDNPNSSTVRYMCELAKIKTPPANVYSFHNNAEAIKYISENDGIIGVIGLNWIDQPKPEMESYLDRITVLEIKGNDGKYYAPTQNNIAEGKYPLARELFVVNCQGFSGLGMGFASFVAGERGQRIILKSGLVPATIPGRKISIRNTVTKDK
ncbi:MAG: phosphate ABC transporter substrate-binding protein [Flavobacterium sp.]|nr:MAG: phosphate ABC transporter substrate-binding protein [Flavobacterium sp.]